MANAGPLPSAAGAPEFGLLPQPGGLKKLCHGGETKGHAHGVTHTLSSKLHSQTRAARHASPAPAQLPARRAAAEEGDFHRWHACSRALAT